MNLRVFFTWHVLLREDMNNNKKKVLIMKDEYSFQFCKIAVGMSFVTEKQLTEKQLTEALAEQAKDSLSNKPHRFIGRMLFEDGWITNKQINFVYYIMQDYTAPL